MSKFIDLSKKLDKIPHLYLGKNYDLGRLQAELDTIDPALFVPYRTKSRYVEKMARDWHGVSFCSPGGTLHDDLSEEYYAPKTNFEYTSLTKQCPYIQEMIEDLGGAYRRARLMRVNPGGSLTWHKHSCESSIEGQWRGGELRVNWYEVIAHVPLRTNPQFSYEVIETASYQTVDFLTEPLRIHRKNYPAGEAWAFNGVHVHNVFNRSKDEPRYTMMLQLDLRTRKTFEIMSAAVERYMANEEGPLIDDLT